MDNESVLNDMLSLPPLARNIEKYTWEKVRPSISFTGGKVLEEGTPIQFDIPGRDNTFVDVKVRNF